MKKKDFILTNIVNKSSILTAKANPTLFNALNSINKNAKNFSSLNNSQYVISQKNKNEFSTINKIQKSNFHTYIKNSLIANNNQTSVSCLISSSITNNEFLYKKNKFNFCEGNLSSFKEKEDYVYIINIRSKTLKNIRRPVNPIINQYWESNKLNSITFKDLQDIEQFYMKLEKLDKIGSTLRVCCIFVKKRYFSKHLIDYFIDNCSELVEDSLFTLNGFIHYINGLELNPNQINFNPNFFKIVEENFFKEGILMDINDMKVYMRFFYRFKSCFSQKLINYAERCLIYLLENENSLNIAFLYDISDTFKYIFISGSERCVQKVVDYFLKMILLRSTGYLELNEFIKITNILTGRAQIQGSILNYNFKCDILVKAFDKLKPKVYEYLTKEKVEINFLKNMLNLLNRNNSMSYYKGINLKIYLLDYIVKNENSIDADNLRNILNMMLWSRSFTSRFHTEITQLILGNLDILDSINHVNNSILNNYIRLCPTPNPVIKEFAELMLIKNFVSKTGNIIRNYPMNYIFQTHLFSEISKNNFSAFLSFCLIDGNQQLAAKIKETQAEQVEPSKDIPVPGQEEENI